MIFPIRAALLFLALIVETAIAANPALAHRFNVAIVIPLSGGAASQGQQFLNGFMLATTERDSHPDQESDGHLGGLDVYVTVIDGTGNPAAEIEGMSAQGKIDIVAVFGPQTTRSRVESLLEGKGIALLPPGRSPFSNSGLIAVAGFISTYEMEYGVKPSSDAAQGYNAARRVDKAVRDQGGVDDTASLLRSFRDTTQEFTW